MLKLSQGSIERAKTDDVSQLLDGSLPGNEVTSNSYHNIFPSNVTLTEVSLESRRSATAASQPGLWTSPQRWMLPTVWP